ncbi:MAG TPA: thioredoxin family protein [Paenalcaligenes sp.]|nr:thioredoxin family protein [Paenalcaligenes sp.]
MDHKSITLFCSMPLLYPEKHTSELQQRLTDTPDAWVLVCYCAAWCRTCAGFETAVEQFARAHPDTICVWVDIEEHEDLLMDEDLEDLPTFALQKGEQSFFYAPLPPMIEHLQRLSQQAEQGLLPALGADDTPLFKQLLEQRGSKP